MKATVNEKCEVEQSGNLPLTTSSTQTTEITKTSITRADVLCDDLQYRKQQRHLSPLSLTTSGCPDQTAPQLHKNGQEIFLFSRNLNQLWGPPAYWGPYTREQSAQGVWLTKHLLPGPGFGMSGAVTPLPVYDLMEWIQTLTFLFSIKRDKSPLAFWASNLLQCSYGLNFWNLCL
jgi:hypothetical protein